jgi:hypothetical protein
MTFPKAIATAALALAPLALALTCAAALAQGSSTPATPAPASTPTAMDRAYDGQFHANLIPYLWLPTIRTNLQYTIPQLPVGGGTFARDSQIGPSDYLTNLNTAGELAFNVRKGDALLLGDYIYVNASATANAFTTLSGPAGKIKVPASFVTNARIATSIWELAAGISLAHGHNADLNLIVGWRQFPLTATAAYTATIGSRIPLTRSGTVKISPLANDVVFGLQGRVYVGDGHWFTPYYIDAGSGSNQQTWEANAGAGYAFPHGQAFVATFRTLQYNGFTSDSPVKKISMWGPLLGYSFGI